MTTKAKTISYSTDVPTAIKKLKNAMQKLDAQSLDYNYNNSMKDSTAFISFTYKGEKYKFEYSRSRAAYFHLNIPNSKDVFIALINGILDLTRVADRGIFDFGQIIQGFKAIEYIEIPSWAIFMGFDTRPRNYMECESRFKELVKGSMSPEKNPDDYRKLQDIRAIYRQYFKVEQ